MAPKTPTARMMIIPYEVRNDLASFMINKSCHYFEQASQATPNCNKDK